MALDFSTWCGFNFRATNGTNFAGDGTNEIGMTGSPQTINYPSEDTDKGWLTSPLASNSSRAIDRRIYGMATASSASSVFTVAAPNGDYDLRLAMSHVSSSARTGVVVVDTLDSDMNGISGILSASGSVSFGNVWLTSDTARAYKVTTAGTYTGDPTGTGTGIKAGTGSETARFKYLGEVVHIADSTSTVTNTSVYDIDGSTQTEGNWATADSGQPHQKSITIQKGGLKFAPHPSATGMYLRHIGLKQQTIPLQGADLRDHTGTTMGASPAIHAGQPTGKLIAQLYFPVGSTASITLGGTLAAYFQVVTFGSNKWLASLLPIPDGTTGDLQVIQTDASSAISGSPFTTTFDTSDDTLTIVSSESKPTLTAGVSGNALAFALISTQCWLNHKLVRETVEATWDGWSDQAFDHEWTATDDASLTTAISSANAAVGPNVWQRIKIASGTYSTDRTWATADYSQSGTGGLIIQGTGTHAITGYWQDSGGWAGVHFDNLNFEPATGGAFLQGIVCNARTDNKHEVVITNCTFGTEGNTNFLAISCLTGTSIRIRDNVFRGYGTGIKAMGVRCVEVGRNDFSEFLSDMLDVNPFNSGTPAAKGLLADDNQYVWFYDCTAREQQDNWDIYTTNNEPHCDLVQGQFTLNAWSASHVYAANSWVFNDNKYYSTTAGGTSGSTAPTHTSGDVSDGGVTWTYEADFTTGPRLYISIYGHRLHASSTTYADLDSAATSPPGGKFIAGLIGFWTDSSGIPTSISVFNNICATRVSGGGWLQGGASESYHYLEYNTFAAPAYVPDVATPSPNAVAAVLVDTKINGPGVFARKNIVGQMGTVALDEDNLLVPWNETAADPGLKLHGPTTANATNEIWGFDTFDETIAAPQFARSLESFLSPLPDYLGYGAALQGASAPAGAVRYTGLSLGLRIGL